MVDFAAMRDAVTDLGGDPDLINPQCPSDLVIDHSVQVDFSGSGEARYIGNIKGCVNMLAIANDLKKMI